MAASAMIDRAELPVQIKSTLNGVPITNSLPRPCIEVVTRPGQETAALPFS